tara:strand:- start:705 stop:953 length:249 start_codon:yes stop_codon:yes gene_type:complete
VKVKGNGKIKSNYKCDFFHDKNLAALEPLYWQPPASLCYTKISDRDEEENKIALCLTISMFIGITLHKFQREILPITDRVSA